jgi:exodeoxyribonuclease VII large subunit
MPLESQNPKVYSISVLTEEIKDLLEENFDFVWVEGEISNFRKPASGHCYMVLKDDRAQLRAVMFRMQSRVLKFTPEDGMKVLAQGRIVVYQPRGEYQIILDDLEPIGAGALALAFDQLKKKLAAEGVFDEAIKKPLPFLPQKVAVITSPTGAAIQDFLKVIQRRFANIEITIVPVKVQGDEAPKEIVEAIKTVNRELDVDVIVLTRGGGSLEDLWAFNQEELAHTIRASRIPVVSAVGHEIDTTISDLAADLRAPTPSAAAEMLVVEKEALIERLEALNARLLSASKIYLTHRIQRLALLSKGIRDPRKALADSWMKLDDQNNRMLRQMVFMLQEMKIRVHSETRALTLHSPATRVASLKEKINYQSRTLSLAAFRMLKDYQMSFSLLEEKLKDLSPLAVLKRGYSITRILPDKNIVRDSADVNMGDHVNVTLAEGGIDCLVEKIHSGE